MSRRRRASRGRKADWRRATKSAAWAALAAVLAIVGLANLVPNLMPGVAGESPAIAAQSDTANPGQASGEWVTERFGRCDGNSFGCVVDGDTIRLGSRRIRLIGFDTPETNARCEEEALAAERATQALQNWLNLGAFEMVGDGKRDMDRYDRELRIIQRPRPDGSTEQVSSYMIDSGLARPYRGGRRPGWCER